MHAMMASHIGRARTDIYDDVSAASSSRISLAHLDPLLSERSPINLVVRYVLVHVLVDRPLSGPRRRRSLASCDVAAGWPHPASFNTTFFRGPTSFCLQKFSL